MAAVKPAAMYTADDDDDDDVPLSFKRNRPAPARQDGPSGNATYARNPKPAAPIPQRNGMNGASRPQPLPLKPQPTGSNPRPSGSGHPNSSMDRSQKSNAVDKSKLKRPHDDRSDDSDDDKPLASRKKFETKFQRADGRAENARGPADDRRPPGMKINSANMASNNSTNKTGTLKPAPKPQKPDEDSDDDHKPLSMKISSAKMASSSANKTVPLNAAAKPQQPDYDSDDDKPLVSRLPGANAASKSAVKKESNASDDDSEDEKPLSARFPKAVAGASASISNSKDKVLSNNKASSSNPNAPRNPVKRPSDSNQTGSALKKAKPSDASASATVKKESNAGTPPVRKLTKGESSNSKPSAVVKKSPSSFKNNKKLKMKTKKNSQFSKSSRVPPGSGDGKKWSTLEHNGVIFPPPYSPHGVKMLYNGQPVELTPAEEEVATMFAVMKDTEYAGKKTFIDNFFGDWRKVLGKNHIIKKFELCDFTPIYEWHLVEKEKKKQMTSEEKKAIREEKLKLEEKFMWAVVDGVKEKVGNFRVEPPGLFRGRGEHPKMGKLKRRIRPSDITINIGEGAPIPKCPIEGESWKEVKHDNTVTWLAFWNDPISQKDFKYVFLAASSSLKGQSDKQKYEKSRKLKDHIQKIRQNYTKDFRSKDVPKKQIAVATYLIDKLALRAGNEKDDDEADTVGCCTLKVDNVTCVPPNKLQFDFLGKDSIRYFNTVEVELPVYSAIEEFRAGKKPGDPVFNELDTTRLNTHLKDLMPGLTAKVFRTYNASITLDAILHKETEDGTLLEKIAVYQRANKEVAIICNHQRAVSKSHDSQMTKLNEKIDELKAQMDELKTDLVKAKKGKPLGNDKDGKPKRNMPSEAIEKKITTIESKIEKMEMDKQTKEDLKTVALGTSKINYLDPRITVAWCKTHEVPIEKIFSKTILAKFGWAMDVEPEFRF
ncbi:DNA topoisomerase 1 beta [Lolium perenne]|uniref:DNA topoisomerase 1 beta n=1 Tax=Lolium perenne TaxID=4522 RepID=UPI0021F5D463|nr:DNA topoisomerase 1 beta-like [Lolium perenne]